MKCNLCGKETNNKNNLCDECNKKHEEYSNKKQKNINKKDDLKIIHDANVKVTLSNDKKEKVEVLKDKTKEDKNSLSLAEKIILMEIVICIGTLFCAYTFKLIDNNIVLSDGVRTLMLILLSAFMMCSITILFPILPGISTLLSIFSGLKNKDIMNFIRILIINIVIWIVNAMILSYSISPLFNISS